MNCQKVIEALPELHDGLLPEPEARALRTHLESCASCRREWQALETLLSTMDTAPLEEPSPRLRAGFNRMLSDELRRERQAAAPSAPLLSRLTDLLLPFRGLARGGFALAMLALGLLCGLQFPKQQVAVPASTPDAETQRQLADLRNRLDAMNQLVVQSFDQSKPESSRLVQAASLERSDDNHQLAKLVGTLAFDPSTNVRLYALEALYPHADKAIVRQGVIAALGRERAPLVQLAMIDFLASIEDPQGAETLRAVVRDANNDKAVREAAQRAMARL